MEYHKISSQILRDHQDDLMWERQGSGAGVEVTTSAANRSIGSTTGYTITEKAPTRTFSWLKAPTSAFKFL